MLALAFVKPLGFDNAMYQAMAVDLYRFGKVPYIGSWDQNFPGIIYIHYLAILLFGSSDFSIRIFDTIIQILFTGFLYRFWSRWLRPGTAALTAILYIAYYTSADGHRMLAERDVYAGMVVILSVWLVMKAREHASAPWAWIVAAGLAGGFGIVLRPTGIIPIAIIGLSILLTDDLRINWLHWTRSLLYVLASLIPIGLVLAYYTDIPGGLEAFYLATIRWNLDLYAKLDNGLTLLALQFARRAFLVPIVIYALIKRREIKQFLIRALSRKELIVYIALTVASLGIALIMRKYFDYHFAPFYMLLMPLAAFGIELIASQFRCPLAHHYAILVGVYCATFLAFIPKAPFAFGLALTMEQNPVEFTSDAQFPDPNWGAKSERAVRQFLSKPENRVGSVEICSFIPYLQLHLGREHVGKYIQLLALAYRLNPDDVSPPRYTDYQLRWQHEYVDAIRTKQPRFIVLTRNTHFGYVDDVYYDLLRYIPGFDSVLGTYYRYDTAFGGYQVFRLRSDAKR